jgi:4-diphosphocytidyl-2-C-methyl-D-erythritol kinase
MASEIGSDVPFCLSGGSRVGSGRGERLSPAPTRGTLWWVVAIDSEGLGTAPVYQRYDELGLARPLRDRWPSELLDALAAGDLERIGAALANDLEPAAFDLHPALEAGKHKLLEAGAVGAVMSGSGPTLLGLASDEEHAGQLAGAVRPAFARVEVARGPVPGVTFG